MFRFSTRPTAIVGLLFRCSPADIARLVMAIDIDSINRMLWRRAQSYIGYERRHIVAPSLTHLNTPSAVVWKHSIFGSITTVDHTDPNPIFVGIGQAMRTRHSCSNFVTQTAARLRCAFRQCAPRWRAHVATIAATSHMRMCRTVSKKFHNCQSAKSIAWLRFRFQAQQASAFSFSASARRCVTRLQLVSGCDYFVAARAEAQPCYAARIFQPTSHSQSAECLAG